MGRRNGPSWLSFLRLVSLHSSLLTKLLLLPQVLLPRVLLVDEDLDNKAFKWFAVDTESRDLPVEIRGHLGLKIQA
jgi:hypothetical protein